MLRREFLGAGAGFALAAQPGGEWGGPVIDIHLHPRRTPGESFAHVQGCGATKAVLLTNLRNADWAKAEIAAHPDRFVWFAAADPTEPENFAGLQRALDGGARGIGEMKSHTAADAKDMRRVYDMCAERKVPVLIHFQETSKFTGEEGWNTGFSHFDAILKAHEKTTFIGHANFFWASISTDLARESEYPAGPVKRTGVTDRWLAEYPNLWGDLSANSGNNALSRDRDFARDFLQRHQNKLLFGSDCSCKDGRGLGSGALLPRLKNKCVGRDTLGLLKDLTAPAVFRKITWTNAHTLLSL
ncbi:MAG TPA: amidohydrolase family protein [Bryobacteraceae bacterium]|nr:amidohydrolase family protein [Bryobacteraceae bacterium]